MHREHILEYLGEQNYSFFVHSQRGDFEPSLFQLKKVQKVIHSLWTHLKEKNAFLKEQWISYMNEIVFLKEHGLLLESTEIHNVLLKIFKEVKPISLMLSNPNVILNSFLLDQLKLSLERDKLKLRVLLSLSIGLSDLGQHKKAIASSQRALKCISKILLQTNIIA